MNLKDAAGTSEVVDLAGGGCAPNQADRAADRNFALYDTEEMALAFRSYVSESEVKAFSETLMERANDGDKTAMNLVAKFLWSDAPKLSLAKEEVEHKHTLDPEAAAIIERFNSQFGGGGVEPGTA